jgi:hypothetical protein
MAEIIITNPIISTVWRVGSTYEIKWESIGNTGPVQRIQLRKTAIGVILDYIFPVGERITTGSFFMYIPNNIDPDTDYKVRVLPTIAPAFVTDEFEIKDRFSITEFSRLEEFQKLVLAEMKTGFEIDNSLTSTWNEVSSAGAYWTPYTGQEIVQVNEDLTELTRYFEADHCDENTGSFFHDINNQRLYIHTTTDDSPNTIESPSAGVTRIFKGYTWLCFCNDQDTENPVDFTPQNATISHFYTPYISESSLGSLTQSVQDYYKSAISIQFGSISFVGADWWWENKENYLWHNNDLFVKLGEKGLSYDQFVDIFPGKTRKPVFSDDGVMFELRDRREGDLKQIPEERFDLTTYPNLDTSFENKVIPILFGFKLNITPVNIDTVNWIYKISDTSFPSGAFPIEDITAVYKDGVGLVEVVDWTSDDANGQFTLLADPGTSEITCDAKGIKCEYDFSDGSTTGNFTENVADILYFILRELNGIPIDNTDLDSFDDLQGQRTQRIAWLLDEGTQTLDFVRLLQSSAIFHFIPDLSGNYTVQYYDRAVPTDAKLFRDDDYSVNSFMLTEDTETSFKIVVVQYDKDPTSGDFKEETISDDDVETKYSEVNTLTIQTALVDQTEAQNLVDFYNQLVDMPGDKLEGEVTPEAFELKPSDKAKFTKIINDITVLNEEVYTILELRKDLNTAKVYVKGLSDSQASGIIAHADIEHSDSHADDYDDSYNDGAHGDQHFDSPHEDDPYQDSYNDHTDNPTEHDDSHADVHLDHNDGVYEDDHGDVPHVDHTDTYSDGHSDGPHTDHTDGTYSDHDDDHDDVEHNDDAYTDLHTDQAHTDDHTDDHTDEHVDIPHTDSEL